METQLEESISGALDAYWVTLVDVNLKNKPNYQIFMVHGVKNH